MPEPNGGGREHRTPKGVPVVAGATAEVTPREEVDLLNCREAPRRRWTREILHWGRRRQIVQVP